MPKLLLVLFSALLCLPLHAAEQVNTAKTLQTSPLSTVNLMQTLLGLLLVLACIVIVAWLLKGSNRFNTSANGKLKVVAGLPIGPRERIVVVQVGEEQLLLGITPQNINTLHTLKQPLTGISPQATPSDFAQKLKQLMSQRGDK